MATFVQRMIRDRAKLLHLVRAVETCSGRRAWYFIDVNLEMLGAFRADEGKPGITLTDYGTIIFSGYGQDPPPDMVRRMLDEYGFVEGK